jgi:hypothetical protein
MGMFDPIEEIHWTKLHGLEVKQSLSLIMLTNEGLRLRKNCRLYGENHRTCPKVPRTVVYDVSYVEKVLKDTIFRPMEIHDFKLLDELIKVAKKNLLDKEVERVKGEVVARSDG